MLGTVRTVLQAGYVLGVVASLPAVKGLRADIKMAAGETAVVTMGIVIIKLFEPLPGFF